jgi:hypothetical protein
MKEDTIGTCAKCGMEFYVHAHHIFPQAWFGKKGETHDLCPNCHTHFHNYSRKNAQNSKDKKEAKKIWEQWIEKVAVVTGTSVVLFFVVKFFMY